MNEKAPKETSSPGHAIRVVSRRTGVSPATLRSWERRHGAVRPLRSDGRQRLYSDEEVERLRLLRLLTDGGHKISHIARLPLDGLRKLQEADVRPRPTAAPGLTTPSNLSDGETRMESLLQSVAELDAPAIQGRLAAAATMMSLVDFLDEVVMPLLTEVGDAWRRRELGPRHEHLLTVQLRRQLEGLLACQESPAGAPAALFTTPAGQRHELGALCAAVTAATSGWQPIYLGADCPADDVVATARSCNVSLIALSMLRPIETRADREDLLLLPTSVSEDVSLVIGGDGATDMAEALTQAGFVVLWDMQSFRSLLDELKDR